MCWFIFIGSDVQLPTLDGRNSAIVIRDDFETPSDVLSLLDREYVYFAISSDGCGCGFQYDSEDELNETLRALADAPEEYRQLEQRTWEQSKLDCHLLRKFLIDGRSSGADIRVYVGWAETPVEVTWRPVSLSEFLPDDEVTFREGTLFEFAKP